jgi:long-chain acyl-CoA synthetase
MSGANPSTGLRAGSHGRGTNGHGKFTPPWPGAKDRPAPAPRDPGPPGPTLDVAAALAGKNILLIGTTGFVGKVALSMLLDAYPDVARVYCLVRPGAGNTADERFYKKVATSEAFDPLRAKHGAGYEAFLRSKIVAIAGDIGRPLCNFTDEQFAEFEAAGGIHVIINSAGLVSFTPPLESALRINALGAKNVLDTARKAGARLCHVSTCYVAGKREGEVWEDEPVVGYFPRKDDLYDRDFDAAAEVADCQRIIDQTREQSNDRAHISEFRERAAKSLEDQRRDPDDEGDLKLAVARERKLWMNQILTELGMERADHWGWTNTYTYTKSLGEQLILADRTVVSTVVRPAVVESSVRYPFPGWNEGFNTTAPLVYLMYKGHRTVPATDVALDVIPVDFVAAGMLLATAALLAGQHEPVYQLGSSDSNRVTSQRLVELTGLAVRGYHRKKWKRGEDERVSRLRARLEARATSYETFESFSAPLFKKLADKGIEIIDEKLPKWGAPRIAALAERAKDELTKISHFTGQVIDLVELFKPFDYDRDVAFRCDNIRALWGRVTPVDQDKLLWAPHLIDWRHYWLETHFPGLQKWVFAELDEEFGAKPRSVYTYKELVELFEAAVKLHRHRTALRLLPKPVDEDDDDDRARRRSSTATPERPYDGAPGWLSSRRGVDREPVTYTYERVGDLAWMGAGVLRQHGIGAGDRVMLMSEGRPEWGISYFAIILAGAIAVPLDAGLSPAEVANLARASGARLLVVSRKQAERLCGEVDLAVPAGADDEDAADDLLRKTWSPAHPALAAWLGRELGDAAPSVSSFDELLTEPDVSPGAVRPDVRGDATASIIFTSGTTGSPKGVVLTHKNLTSMVAKLSSVFTLYKHDKLLSVLPLHHTFEFSAGFLMPLVHGASIDYLEEVEAESLSHALENEGITGMVGVPALWQLLERKIWKRFSDRGVIVEKIFDVLVDLNRQLREGLPWDVGTGRAMFFPIHRKLGGRMRLLISGGSALPADTMKAFRGLGFDLFEGYGMTEASPVLTVTRPGDEVIPGSVGRALPGIDVRIDNPDENGVGEVVAKGPNVMSGYYQNAEATAETIKGGWLHTGDLGRLDADGNLFIVGRKKEMILGASGENVYPDELEDLYGESPYVKEVSVVGLPIEGGESVAALVVPDYEASGTREEIRAHVRDHMKKVSASLPLYKRVKTFHLWDFDLPKTSTRKVKRREVVKELERLERAAKGGAEARKLADGATSVSPGGGGTSWIHDVIADTAQKKRGQVTSESRLDELGYDSLMFTELAVALEAAGVTLPDPSELVGLETVADVEKLVDRLGAKARADRPRLDREKKERDKKEAASDDIDVPAPIVRAGRRLLRAGMRGLYERYLDTDVRGKAYVPPFGGYIVAANHASHLDTGLVKHALGEQGDVLTALAAKDYFFEDPVRRAYFENFTNLVPMERHGSLRESLRLAADVIKQGYILLIFPEGTRSDTGVMADFKPSLGYLAMTNKCGILPMFLAGTYAAMPKGKYLPTRGAYVSAHVGPYLDHAAVAKLAAGKSRSEAYKAIATTVEGQIRRLAPTSERWALGEAGTTPYIEWAAKRPAGEGQGHGQGADQGHGRDDADEVNA